ncbi:MAG: spondin domain-containing protein, partial [Planctomycetota bacterium]
LGPPLAPGSVNRQVFTIDTDGSNTYFSYAAMVLQSNDCVVANGNPFAHDLSSLFTNGGSISFNIGQAGTVNDAGTEAEDFNTAAPPLGGLNMFFPAAGFGGDAGQSMGNEGAADPNNLIRNVIGDPYAGFANNNGFDLSLLNFNNLSNYPNGIARITITAVPEPATIGVLAVGMVGLVARRCR